MKYEGFPRLMEALPDCDMGYEFDKWVIAKIAN
jgi:hypothetical protein